MKRVLLPIIFLGLTLSAFANADLTSARIYRNQGEFVKAVNFFSLAIEKNPDLYLAYFERGELYGMIAVDRTKKGVLRDLAGETDDPQRTMIKRMLADFEVVKGVEDERQQKKLKKSLKKIDTIIEQYWTDFYNNSIGADTNHVQQLALADSLIAAGDTTTLVQGSESLTLYQQALNAADKYKKDVIRLTELCILLNSEEWNPYALKAQVLDRAKEIEAANEVWSEALTALNSSGEKEEDYKKYTDAWRIIQLHRLQNYYNTDDFEKTIEVANEIIAVCNEEGITPSAIETLSEEEIGRAGHCKDAYVFKAFSVISMVSNADSTADMTQLRTRAIDDLKEAHLVSPDDSAIPFYLGQYYLENGDTTQCLEWWTKYTALDKEDFEVLFQIGYIHLEGGSYIDYKKAEAAYQEMVTRHPEQCKGWINLGVAQIKQDKTKLGADNVRKGEECSKQSGE